MIFLAFAFFFHCFLAAECDDLICTPNPCLNGGSCQDLGDHQFKCNCANETYQGKYCQLTHQKCDSSYSEIEGEFSSPDYPAEYPLSNCSQFITAPHSARINLTLDTVWLRRMAPENGKDRCIDILEICDGSSCNAMNVLASGCSPFSSLNVISFSNQLTVRLVIGDLSAETTFPYSGFRATYFSGVSFCDTGFKCQNGGTCMESPASVWCECPASASGVFCEIMNVCSASNGNLISSPGWPSVYPANADCSWELEAGSDQVVHINFVAIDLAIAEGGCVSKLVVQDDKRTVGLCERPQLLSPLASDLVMHGPKVKLQFLAGDTGRHAGFLLEYRTAVNYCSDSDCSSYDACVNLFDGYQCIGDDACSSYVCLNHGTCYTNGTVPFCFCPDGYWGDHCETQDPCDNYECLNGGTCIQEGNGATCRCKSEYQGAHCDSRACGQDFKDIFSGSFTSPFYPASYLPGQNCSWSIKGPPNSSVLLEFVTFALGREDCLLITDQEVTIRACGNSRSKPSPVESKRPLLVTFTAAKEVVTGTGFFASFNIEMPYREMCTYFCFNGGTCVQSDGATTVCSCPSGYSGVQCQVDDFCDPNPCLNGGTCVHAEDKASCVCNPPFTGSFCETVSCGGTIDARDATKLNPAAIQSPNFPEAYPSYSDCQWDLQFDNDSKVTLDFSIFDLENTVNCTFDFVTLNICSNNVDCKLFDTNSKRLCGQFGLDGKLFNSLLVGAPDAPVPFVRVGFHSDSDSHGNFRGFLMNYYSAPGLCQTGFCENGGTCVEKAEQEQPTCICAAGFSGSKCETDLWCGSNPCLYMGTCVRNSTNHWCACLPELSGDNCEKAQCGGVINSDSGTISSPLAEYGLFVANAKCSWSIGAAYGTAVTLVVSGTSDADKDLSCDTQHVVLTYVDGSINKTGSSQFCGSSESGPFSLNLTSPENVVNIDYVVSDVSLKFVANFQAATVNKCSSSPCHNNATCVTEPYSYHCDCRVLCWGAQCDSCVNNVCEVLPEVCNSGTCVPFDQGRRYHCVCPPDYTGDFCESLIGSSTVPSRKSKVNRFHQNDSGFLSAGEKGTGLCSKLGKICNEGDCVEEEGSKDYRCRCPENNQGTYCDA